MRVYIRHEKYNFAHPDDMEKIIDYLTKHGKILVSYKTIEDLYYTFSHIRYSAGWLNVREETLEEFSDWLNEYTI